MPARSSGEGSRSTTSGKRRPGPSAVPGERADPSLDPPAIGEGQLDDHGLALLQVGDARLGHVDAQLDGAVAGQLEDRRARSDDLAGLREDGGDRARERGAQRGLGQRAFRFGELGRGGVARGGDRVGRGREVLELLGRRGLGGDELFRAGAVPPGLVLANSGLGERRSRRLGGMPRTAVVESGHPLAGADVVADFHAGPQEPRAHREGQDSAVASTGHAGVADGPWRRRGGGGLDAHIRRQQGSLTPRGGSLQGGQGDRTSQKREPQRGRRDARSKQSHDVHPNESVGRSIRPDTKYVRGQRSARSLEERDLEGISIAVLMVEVEGFPSVSAMLRNAKGRKRHSP